MAMYHYHINGQGIITHEGIIIEDHSLIDLVYKNMDINRTGTCPEARFYARIGNEEIFLHTEDTPIVWKYLQDDRLCMTDSISIPFSIRDLRFSKEGNLYHRSQLGGWGRMSARLLVEMRVKRMLKASTDRHMDQATIVLVVVVMMHIVIVMLL